MARKPPRVKMMKPRLQATEFRTVVPQPRTFANRVAQDPTLRFYQTTEWRILRADVLRERGRICETCGHEASRPYVDHKHEIRDGGSATDRANLQVLCHGCHVRKSGQARAARFGLV